MLHSLDYSFLLPLIGLFFYIRKIRISATIIVLATYLAVFFVFNHFFSEVKSVLGKKEYYFFYTLLEYFSLSTLILLSISDKIFRLVYAALSFLFTIFLIVFFFAVNIKRLDSIPIGIESIVLMILIIFYFYSQFKNISDQNIYDSFSFWIVLGILIYIGFTFFFNILSNSLDQNLFSKYYHYSFLGDILKNILFAVAIIFFTPKSSGEKNQPHSYPYLDMP